MVLTYSYQLLFKLNHDTPIGLTPVIENMTECFYSLYFKWIESVLSIRPRHPAYLGALLG